MLGASVYVIPFMIQRHVPGIGPYVLPAFLVAAVPAILAAFAYSMLASAMPRAGGTPHGWNTTVGLAADLQFQATVSDEKYCMVEVRPQRTITDLLKNNPFSLDAEGKITVPTGTGLGVELIDEFRN